jgi:hypothetical protein
MLESPRFLKKIKLSIKPSGPLSVLSLTNRVVNLSENTYNIGDVAPDTLRTKASTHYGTCISSHQTEPMNSPLKSGHFLSEVRDRALGSRFSLPSSSYEE